MKISLNSKDLIQKALQTLSVDNIVSGEIEVPADYDFSDLLIDHIRSEEWPVAVDPLLIATDTDEDKRMRAELIVELIIVDQLNGKKVLDFGCGNGFVAEAASKTASVAVGYDIETNPEWSKHKTILTTDRQEVEKHAPYDIILLYDTLDHVMDNTQVEILKYLKSICSGKIITRFHPWCSKNGTHLYKSFNKAFAQFFLTDDAIKKYGYSHLPTVKVLYPKYQYNKWIREAGLKVIAQDVHDEPMDERFFHPEWSSIMINHYGASCGGKFPKDSLSSQFWDFTLVKK